jgi:hypothetical protein
MYMRTREGLGEATWKEEVERSQSQLTQTVTCTQRAAQINVARAVQGNRFEGKNQGWAVHTHKIERLLGYTTKKPDEELFARSVAYWQCMQDLAPVDGIIGENTWKRMRALFKLECPGYMPGEKEKSSTPEGHLPGDVILLQGDRLWIADFEVGKTYVKPSAMNQKLLKDWLSRFENDAAYKLEIIGYSDCVGREKDNLELRRGRAEAIFKLLKPGVQARVIDKPRAAPAGTYLSENFTFLGRAKNRAVIIKFQPPPKPKEKRPVTDCVVRPSQVLVYPLMRLIPNVPFDRSKLPLTYRLDAKKMVGQTAQDISKNSHRAELVIEAAHWGITALEIFEIIAAPTLIAGILSIAAPILGLAAGFLALGSGCAQAAEDVAKDQSASGYSCGIVVGADGRKALELKQMFGNEYFPPDRFCHTENVAKANYLMGLFVGYMHGRMLCPNQREWFWRDLGYLMGDQSRLGPSTRWSDSDWRMWYLSAAGAFGKAHLK